MSNEQRRPRVQWSRWLWIGYWIALFIATHLRRPPSITLGIRHGDKLLHFLVYFGLTLLGGRHLRATRRSVSGRVLFRWVVIYAVYGVFDEWLQQFVGRSATLGDWIADVLGVVAATVLLLLSPRETELSEPPEPGD